MFSVRHYYKRFQCFSVIGMDFYLVSRTYFSFLIFIFIVIPLLKSLHFHYLFILTFTCLVIVIFQSIVLWILLIVFLLYVINLCIYHRNLNNFRNLSLIQCHYFYYLFSFIISVRCSLVISIKFNTALFRPQLYISLAFI